MFILSGEQEGEVRSLVKSVFYLGYVHLVAVGRNDVSLQLNEYWANGHKWMKSLEGVTFLVTLHENDEMLHSACEQLAVPRPSSLVSVPGFLFLCPQFMCHTGWRKPRWKPEVEQDCNSRVDLWIGPIQWVRLIYQFVYWRKSWFSCSRSASHKLRRISLIVNGCFSVCLPVEHIGSPEPAVGITFTYHLVQ